MVHLIGKGRGGRNQEIALSAAVFQRFEGAPHMTFARGALFRRNTAMDVKQMTYILTIAQEGGISKAASQLFTTQSALGSN